MLQWLFSLAITEIKNKIYVLHFILFRQKSACSKQEWQNWFEFHYKEHLLMQISTKIADSSLFRLRMQLFSNNLSPNKELTI